MRLSSTTLSSSVRSPIFSETSLRQKIWLIDFIRHAHTHKVTATKGQTVDLVQSYKYLGTNILASLRNLSYFHIAKTTMTLFFLGFCRADFILAVDCHGLDTGP